MCNLGVKKKKTNAEEKYKSCFTEAATAKTRTFLRTLAGLTYTIRGLKLEDSLEDDFSYNLR